MSEVLMTYSETITDPDGTFVARAVGRRARDNMWEGWLEFIPVGLHGSEAAAHVIVGPVESRQPEREHLLYWASGLTPVFLEGALHRARTPLTVEVRTEDPPLSEAPAARRRRVVTLSNQPEPVLDPFDIGARNLDILRQELTALNRPRLLNIIRAYDLNPLDEDIGWMTDEQLVHFIVVAVDLQLPQRIR